MCRDSVPGAGTTRRDFRDGVRGFGLDVFFVCYSVRARPGVGAASEDGHVGWGVAIGGDDDWCAARVLWLG